VEARRDFITLLGRHVASAACCPLCSAGLGATIGSSFGTPPGKRTVNTEPLPVSLATVMSPPIIWQNFRLITRQRTRLCAADEHVDWRWVLLG
jgi:hypothetical protein